MSAENSADDNDIDIEALSKQVADQLGDRTKIGDKYLLSRRQLLGIAGSGASAGLLSGLMSDNASAQTGLDSIGTESEPLDAIYVDQLYQNTDNLSLGALEAEDLYTDDRGAKFVITADGSDHVISGTDSDGEIARNTDCGAAIQTLADNHDPAKVAFKSGFFNFDSTVTLSGNGWVFEGQGDGTIPLATSAITAFFKIQKSGGTVRHAPKFRDMRPNGNGNANHFLYIDSSERGEVAFCRGVDFTDSFIYMTSDQDEDAKWWSIHDSKVSNAPKFLHAEAGSSRHPADNTIKRVNATRISDWAFDLVSCQRFRLEEIYATDGSGGMNGVFRATHPGSASGAPTAIDSGHIIDNLEMETGNSTAPVCIHLDADGSDFFRNHIIKSPRVFNGKAIELRSTGGNRNLRGVQIRDLLKVNSDEDHIDIGSGVFVTDIRSGGDRASTIWNDMVTDNGDFTTLNGRGSESANAETPTSDKWDVGTIVDFSDTGDGSGNGLYLKAPDGSFDQLA